MNMVKSAHNYCIAENKRLLEEISRLKAEVEGLKAEKDQVECDYDNCYKRLVRIDDARYDLFMEIESLKAKVERLTKAGEWRPIETAPKDGGTILTYRKGNAFVMPHYYGNSSYEMTHWMPLPSAPAKEGKQE